MAHAGSMGAKLDASELEEIQTVINNKLLCTQANGVQPQLSRKDLDDVLTLTCEKIMAPLSYSSGNLNFRTALTLTVPLSEGGILLPSITKRMETGTSYDPKF